MQVDELPEAQLRKVLVVESEILLRITISEHLRAHNLTVIEARNAEEALAYLRGDPAVDLVFAATRLKGAMDGIEMINWIRVEFPFTRLVITADVSDVDSKLRGVDFIAKPYIPAHVLTKILAGLDGN